MMVKGRGREERHVTVNGRREIDIWWWREEGEKRDMWRWMGEGREIYDGEAKRRG
jgi:hypothetical protein